VSKNVTPAPSAASSTACADSSLTSPQSAPICQQPCPITDRGRPRRAGVRYCMDIIDLAFFRRRHDAGDTQQQSPRRASAADVPVDGVVSPPRGTLAPTTGEGPRTPGYRCLGGGAGGVQLRWERGGTCGLREIGSLGRAGRPGAVRGRGGERPGPRPGRAAPRARCHPRALRRADRIPRNRSPAYEKGGTGDDTRRGGRERQGRAASVSGAARPQLSAGRSALVALEARDGAVDGGVADGRVVEGDLAVLGGDALRGGGLLRLAVVVELHHRELAGVDLDQRELVVLHGEHGVADGAGLAVAAHDLGGEGGVLAVQRDRDGAVLLARGVG